MISSVIVKQLTSVKFVKVEINTVAEDGSTLK